MNYKNETFEEFLQESHQKICPMILSAKLNDDLLDYNNWVSKLEIKDIMMFAELYGSYQYLSGKAYILNKILNKMDKIDKTLNDFRLTENEFTENL